MNWKRVHRIWKAEGLTLPLRRPRRCRVAPVAEIVNRGEYPKVEVFEWLFLTHGVPKYLRSNNGPGFVARTVCQWLEESGCQSLFIKCGSP